MTLKECEYITTLPNDDKFDYFLYLYHNKIFYDIEYTDKNKKDFIRNKIDGYRYDNGDKIKLTVKELLELYPVVRKRIEETFDE